MERQIGEVFGCDGDLITVVGSSANKCEDCYFDGSKCMNKYDERGLCSPDDRSDGRCVIFKKLDDAEGHEAYTILDEAKEILQGNRQSDYGDAANNFERISYIVNNVYPELKINAEQCCMVLIAVKLIREGYRHKRDNLVDLCGYAHIMNEINESNKKGE